MPDYQSHEDNMAEFGADYDKVEGFHMKDFTDAVRGGSARKACDDMIGNIVETSQMSANKHHGISLD